MTTPSREDGENAPQTDNWAERPERGSQFMLRLMLFLSRRLGRRLSRLVLVGISLYFLLFVPAARKASRSYLQRVLDRPPGWRDIFRHFHAFSSTIHDRVYLLDDRFDLFDIEIVNKELFDEARGMVLIGAHFGSFEVMRAIGRGMAGRKISMLMYEENARKINATLALIKPEAVNDIIPLGRMESMLEARERLADGHLVGMLADRTLEQDTPRLCPFLGEPAPFALGPFRMAALLQSPVIFMAGVYLGGNRYRVHFERLADFSGLQRGAREQATLAAQDAYVAMLERFCRESPYNWFNFYDFWHPDDQPMAATKQDQAGGA